MRYRELDWKLNFTSGKLPVGVRTICDLFEKDLAPTLFIMALSISVGGFGVFSVILTLIFLLVSAALLQQMKKADKKKIMLTRLGLVLVTLIYIITVMGDDHVFADSTIPQKVEMYMTGLAIARHKGWKPGEIPIPGTGEEDSP